MGTFEQRLLKDMVEGAVQLLGGRAFQARSSQCKGPVPGVCSGGSSRRQGVLVGEPGEGAGGLRPGCVTHCAEPGAGLPWEWCQGTHSRDSGAPTAPPSYKCKLPFLLPQLEAASPDSLLCEGAKCCTRHFTCITPFHLPDTERGVARLFTNETGSSER